MDMISSVKYIDNKLGGRSPNQEKGKQPSKQLHKVEGKPVQSNVNDCLSE